MDVKSVASIFVIIVVSLGTTIWIGYRKPTPNTTSDAPPQSYSDDSVAPTLDEDGERPKAVADETTYQFGNMLLGTTGTHNFVLKNEGEDVLVIAKGASTCKCTVSDLPSNEIPPGESAEVLLEWEPKAVSKEFAQQARIWTNDPDRRSIDFRVEGSVSQALTLVPGTTLDAGSIQEGIGAKTRLRLYSNLVDEFPPPTVHYEGDLLNFEVKPLNKEEMEELEAKNGYGIEVEVVPNVPVGKTREYFDFVTEVDGEESRKKASVSFNRTGPVRILKMPGTVYFENFGLVDFQRFDSKEGKTQEVTVIINDPEDQSPIEVSVAENELEEMLVTVSSKPELDLKDKQAFRVVFEIPPGTPPLNRARKTAPKIVLSTTHPDVQEIVLHVEIHSY